MRHPIVRSLIAIPLGILLVMPLFDLLHIATHDQLWPLIAFWALTVGSLGGLFAIGAEVYEFRRERPLSRPYRLTLFQIGGFVTALLLYLTSWFIRVWQGPSVFGGGEAACSGLASVILLVVAFFGGKLTDWLHIGLSEDPTAEAAARRAEGIKGVKGY